jgi:Lon-like ATP-dependent protease
MCLLLLNIFPIIEHTKLVNKGGNYMIGYYILGGLNLLFTAVITIYFFNMLKGQQTSKVLIEKESKKEIEKLQRLREIRLTEPLSEKTRPTCFEDVIGQDRGIKALKAALCSPNPQHVIIYGPPGIGKTAAARLVLEDAKKSMLSPFGRNAKFVELDATTVRFDDRGIADPLIGSVHDPIYQGAGAFGVAGIPQPKPGAVTKAHGGILFLDEIGELHSIQMNKLLKVLEDRKVFLESSYYNSEDSNIPAHIKDIFDNGLPADFRLVGATTRSPEELPAAIRSRCIEVFFKALNFDEIQKIASSAAEKGGFVLAQEGASEVSKYSGSGRDAVNIIQLAGGLALSENRKEITMEDINWVVESGNYSMRPEKLIDKKPQIGYVNGLAVFGPNMGIIIEVEVTATAVADTSTTAKIGLAATATATSASASALATTTPIQLSTTDPHATTSITEASFAKSDLLRGGSLTVTGIIEEEETGDYNRKFRRKSTSRGSVENVLTVVKKYLAIDPKAYDIHINFPGGVPIDGPSAGIAIATAIYSAVNKIPVNNEVAMTGEVSIRGFVKPIGGVCAKIEAAKKAGVKKVIIPRENWQESFNELGIKIVPVERIEEVMKEALMVEDIKSSAPYTADRAMKGVLSADSC